MNYASGTRARVMGLTTGRQSEACSPVNPIGLEAQAQAPSGIRSHLGADSEEKHEPVIDIDTQAVD